MDTWVIVLAIVVAVLVVLAVLAAWTYSRRRRTGQLRDTFGPEYDRTVKEKGRGEGEKDLLARRERVSVLEIRALSAQERDRFAEEWSATQATFVDDPSRAINEADRLVADVMKTRGYPVEDDFERRAADISVDHPVVVENYRSAHATAVMHRRGDATTEELRQAMVKYRALFAELLESGERDDRLVPKAEQRQQTG